MANTFTSLKYHIIFSTKNREPWLTEQIAPRLWKYIEVICADKNATVLAICGMPDHLHLLVGLPPQDCVSETVKNIKALSSIWIKRTFPDCAGFAWQDGYGAFTVSQSAVDGIVKYIANQTEHHRVKTFEEEFRAFLAHNDIKFEERYLLG